MSDIVTHWLKQLGLGQYAEAFEENSIGPEHISQLDHETLKEIGVRAVGHRMTILNAAANPENQIDTEASPKTDAAPPTPLSSPEAERRHLTVMFCDLVGSTVLSECLDPEELREILAGYQESCAAVVAEFDGYVARYVGDGVLAYFGFPHAHEDDAARAVHAGLGIVDAIRRLDADTCSPSVHLAVRIGIATGMVVVGDIGSGERHEEGAVVGEAPNLAARLQGLAGPGQVIIAEHTRELVEGLFVVESLGDRKLKGVSGLVRSYRVQGPSGAPGRFEAVAEHALTPFVGRNEELALLVNRWDQAKQGEPQLVFISGEAGVGKSRLLRSFRERLKEGEPHNRVLYFGSPYHENSAFYVVIDQLERGLGFQETDSASAKLDKLESVIRELGLPVPEFAPVIAGFLSVTTDERYARLALDPERFKKHLIAGLIEMIEAMSARAPVLMVVEDAHWLDPSSLEYLTTLTERLVNVQLLLVVTARPEFSLPVPGNTRLTELRLSRFGRAESAEIVDKITGGKSLPGEVLEEIIAKTDGVPLFVEELTKTVLESGLLTSSDDHFDLSGPLPPLAIPASLHDSLMARLDRLAEVKELAQLAATCGRSFTYALVASVSTLDEASLDNALSRLVDSGLVYKRGVSSSVTYEFKHALVRDAAYESLLKSTRQQFHQRIAKSLESGFPGLIETQSEVLAHHYTEAGLAEPAIEYWHNAGRQALRRSANLEAISHLEQGLALLDTLEEDPMRKDQEIDLLLALGVPVEYIHGVASEKAEWIYPRACELCESTGDTERLFPALWGSWRIHMGRASVVRAQELSEELLALAERSNNTDFLLQALHAGWSTRPMVGDFRGARQHAERGIALYRLEDHGGHGYVYGGHDPGTCALYTRALCLCVEGHADQARQQAVDAIALGSKLDDPKFGAHAMFYTLFVYQMLGEHAEVERLVEEVARSADKAGFSDFRDTCEIFAGWAKAVRGDRAEWIAQMERGLAAQPATSMSNRPYFLLLLAEVCGEDGQTERGLQYLADAFAVVESTGECEWEAELHRLKGSLLLSGREHDTPEAEACLRSAIDVARGQEAKTLELRAVTTLAQLWSAQGKNREACAELTPIYEWFTEGFETRDLKDAKALLKELS